MIQSTESLKEVLAGTVLEGRPISERWPSSSTVSAFVIEVEPKSGFDDWSLLMSLIHRTGRYPVFGEPEMVELMFLDALPHEGHRSNGDEVQKTYADSLRTNPAEFLASGGTLNEFSPTVSTGLFGWLDISLDHWAHPLGAIQKRFGSAPSVQLILDLRAAGKVRTDAELERWLFDWEFERFGDAALKPDSIAYLDGYALAAGSPRVAVLLPTPEASAALIYMGWWGLEHCAAERAAALRVWRNRYGAELIAAFGTTLHMQVNKRPQTVDEAFVLALEHYHFASDTLMLPGVSLREHARSLLTLDHWFFHSKP